MSDFRIAHLTDLHLTTRRDWLNPVVEAEGAADFLRRAYRHWFEGSHRKSFSSLFYPSGYNVDAAQKALHVIIEHDFDAVLITGDLATTGEDSDLRAAIGYLSGDVPDWWHGGGRIPSLIGSIPVVTMPGNHDRYSGALAMPASVLFEKHLGLYWDLEQEITDSHRLPSEESGRVRTTTFKRKEKRLAIITADMSLRFANQAKGGLFAYYGQGQAVPQVLSEMVESTNLFFEEAEEEGLTAGVIWAVHFPPEFPHIQEELRLLDGIELVRAAAESNVSLIVSGHTHQTGEYVAEARGQSIRVICSGPTCGLSEHGQYGFTALEFDIPAPKQIVCTPKHFQWTDWNFVEQSSYPALV